MTYNDGYNGDDDTGRATIFVVALAITVLVVVVLCALGSWP